MKYAYEDLSEAQFEQLVVAVCSELFGIGVQAFAAGPDGGRDGKFVGRANEFPSKSAPWDGTTIIQAKHTNGINQRCSDSDFFSKDSSSCVIAKEVPRIKTLFESGELQFYFLVTNRRVTGNSQQEIASHISSETGLSESNIHLGGIEYLESILRLRPNIPASLKIDPVDSPLSVSPTELAEIVETFSIGVTQHAGQAASAPTPRLAYEQKNLINSMDADYAREQRSRFLKYTPTIKEFLEKPENARILGLYESAVEEFQLKIISKRKDYQTFDQVLEYLLDLLFKRDTLLRSHKRLTRAILFYMYWNCDLGKEETE